MKLFGYITLVSLAASALWSCQVGVCTDNQNSIPCAAFYSSTTGKQITLTHLEISGVGAPDDALLYSGTEGIEVAYLPLKSTTDITSFRFHFTDNVIIDPETGETVQDTSLDDFVSFRYTATPYFAGEDCGAMYHYHIEEVDYTRHYIDRVELIDSLITNNDAVRVAIYWRTQTEGTDTEGGQQ